MFVDFARLCVPLLKAVFLVAALMRVYRKKGHLRPARAVVKRNLFCLTVACRSVLAGRPGW